MKIGFSILAGTCFFFPILQGGDEPVVSLSVPSGAPLRLYLTKKISKRAGTPVEAKILEPVFAFDKEVVPAGSVVTGKVSQVQPVTKLLRFRAVVNGDFTPLRDARLEFGIEPVKVADLAELGVQPSADSMVHARLLTALDSATAKKGETVEAVVTAPLFSANQKLVLPEGTRLVGTVTVAKKARSFH